MMWARRGEEKVGLKQEKSRGGQWATAHLRAAFCSIMQGQPVGAALRANVTSSGGSRCRKILQNAKVSAGAQGIAMGSNRSGRSGGRCGAEALQWLHAGRPAKLVMAAGTAGVHRPEECPVADGGREPSSGGRAAATKPCSPQSSSKMATWRDRAKLSGLAAAAPSPPKRFPCRSG